MCRANSPRRSLGRITGAVVLGLALLGCGSDGTTDATEVPGSGATSSNRPSSTAGRPVEDGPSTTTRDTSTPVTGATTDPSGDTTLAATTTEALPTVLRAVVAIPRGTSGDDVISGMMAEWTGIPEDFVPASAVTDESEIRGRVTLLDIAEGSVLLSDMFVDG